MDAQLSDRAWQILAKRGNQVRGVKGAASSAARTSLSVPTSGASRVVALEVLSEPLHDRPAGRC